MKKIIALLIAAMPLLAFGQVPNLSNSAMIKFQDGNNVYLKRLDSLLLYVNAGAGTVSSVDVSGGSTGLTASGGPITTSGTITLGGTLGAGFGGTGLATYTIGDLLYASGTTTLSKLAGVATGNALISGGVATAPSWGKIGLTTHVSGTLPVANGGTNMTTVGGNGTILGSDGSAIVYLSPTITTTAASIAYSRNGSNLELNLPNADASNRGTVSTATQTFAGNKTFNGSITGGAGLTVTASASLAAVYATGVQGSSWTTETSTMTVDETDNFLEIGTLSAAITVNLPACNATRSGWEFRVLKTGSDVYGVILDPNGTEAFHDAATTKTIYSQGNGAMCKCKWNGSSGSWFFSTQM